MMHEAFPFLEGTEPMKGRDNLGELGVNRWWKAQLAIIGLAGVPELKDAGNVIRPWTQFKMSMRLPPTKDPHQAFHQLKELFLHDVPYGAKIQLIPDLGTGFIAPTLSKQLQNSLDSASNVIYIYIYILYYII